jgi:hypothetical protein
LTFAINVRGGTNAGIRVVKTLAFWVCDVCGESTDKYACPNIACGTRRP